MLSKYSMNGAGDPMYGWKGQTGPWTRFCFCYFPGLGVLVQGEDNKKEERRSERGW